MNLVAGIVLFLGCCCGLAVVAGAGALIDGGSLAAAPRFFRPARSPRLRPISTWEDDMKKTTGLLLLGAVALVGAWAVVPGQTKAAQVEEQLRRMIAERTAQTNSEMVRQVPGRFEIVDIRPTFSHTGLSMCTIFQCATHLPLAPSLCSLSAPATAFSILLETPSLLPTGIFGSIPPCHRAKLPFISGVLTALLTRSS